MEKITHAKEKQKLIDKIVAQGESGIRRMIYHARIAYEVAPSRAISDVKYFLSKNKPIRDRVLKEMKLRSPKNPPCIQIGNGKINKPWPAPTPEMLKQLDFQRVWESIKTWDIHVPEVYQGYCGATGNHVRAILDAIVKPSERELESFRALAEKAITKWNKDCIGFKLDSSDKDSFFKWNQLVWQEIDMWCRRGNKVSPSEVAWLSQRRGFSEQQKNYLVEMLKYLGLWEEN